MRPSFNLLGDLPSSGEPGRTAHHFAGNVSLAGTPESHRAAQASTPSRLWSIPNRSGPSPAPGSSSQRSRSSLTLTLTFSTPSERSCHELCTQGQFGELSVCERQEDRWRGAPSAAPPRHSVRHAPVAAGGLVQQHGWAPGRVSARRPAMTVRPLRLPCAPSPTRGGRQGRRARAPRRQDRAAERQKGVDPLSSGESFRHPEDEFPGYRPRQWTRPPEEDGDSLRAGNPHA